MFKIDNNFVKAFLPKPAAKPVITQPAQTQTSTVSAKSAEAQFVGATNKAKLEKQFAANQPTPFKALEQINNLPKPDLTDPAAVRIYKEQRRTIADNAVNNSTPPRIEDFRNSGLNGATASYEHREAVTSYNSQISELKAISADAQTYPDRILTPGAAVIEINNLPRPDRNDPQAIQNYNNQRAAIADSALMFDPQPPKIEDFRHSGLNGATASYEYREALSSYNSSISQLKEASQARYSSTPPPITDAEVEQAAQDLINEHGGANNEDEAYAVGRDLAEIAETNPEEAALIMSKVQEKLNGTTYGDNAASGFVDNVSDAQLREIAETFDGKTMLENLKSHLLDGDVHESEQNQADRIGLAVDPGAQIAEWLDQRPSEYYEQKVYDYLKSVEDSGDLDYMREVGDKIADAYSSWSEDQQEDFLNFITGDEQFATFLSETDSGGNNELVSDYVKKGVKDIQEGNFSPDTIGNILEVAAGNEQVSLELLNQLRTEGLGDYADKGGAAVSEFLDFAVLSRDQKDGESALALFVEGAKDFQMENAMMIFNTVAANDRHIEQEGVTDALSTIFLEHGDAYLLSPQFASDGYANEAKAETLANYFQHALFSEDGTKTTEVIDYVNNFSIRVAEHITKGEPLPGVTGSYPVEESAKLLGSLYRTFADGLKQANASAAADAEQQKKMFGLVAGLAFAFIPGGSAVTAGLSSTVAKTVTEYIYSKTVDGVKAFTEKEVQELIGLGVPREVAEKIKDAPADMSARLEAFGLPADVATDLEDFMNNGGGKDPVTQMRGLILIALPPNLEGNFQDGYDETGNRLEN